LGCNIRCSRNFDIRKCSKIALKTLRNKIATNTLSIEKTNVAIGNAGMLPTVTATVLDNNSIQNSSQRQDGTKTELDNAKNNSLTYGVGLDGPFFDGMRMLPD
jgi:hypothetical protein